MNIKRTLIRELMFFVFELSHSAAEATENIWYTKGDASWAQYSKQMICKNLINQAMSDRFKTEDFEAMLRALKTNPTSTT